MDQLLNNIEADVQKALMQDDTFGGLAMGSELKPSDYPPPDNGFEGVTVWIEVVYRVTENDPYTIF